MAKIEENELLTRVGKGTPMGELLRRYWWPVTGSGRLINEPVVPIRLLGEDLTLFRDLSGQLGLLDRRCAHRRVDLRFGIVTEDGLRCMYHGWLYNKSGECVDMPVEPEGRAENDKVKIKSYPVEELGGLIWAYIGPSPAPLLPKWDVLVWDNAFRHVGGVILDANWLQCMENSVDTAHTEFNHGWWLDYTIFTVGGGTGDKERDAIVKSVADSFKRRHIKTRWETFEHGIRKFRLREGEDEEESPEWTIGHPLVFPLFVRLAGKIRNELQIRVPVDDEHTLHLDYFAYTPGPDVAVPEQEFVPYFEHPVFDDRGRPIVDYVLAQDMAAWWGQGSIVDRENEWLATSDTGVLMLRRMLMEQMQIVQDGGDPINVFRDPASNGRIDLPVNIRPGPIELANEEDKDRLSAASISDEIFLKHYQVDRYSPVVDDIVDIFKRYAEARKTANV